MHSMAVAYMLETQWDTAHGTRAGLIVVSKNMNIRCSTSTTTDSVHTLGLWTREDVIPATAQWSIGSKSSCTQWMKWGQLRSVMSNVTWDWNVQGNKCLWYLKRQLLGSVRRAQRIPVAILSSKSLLLDFGCRKVEGTAISMKDLPYEVIVEKSIRLRSSLSSVQTAEDLYQLAPAKFEDTTCSPEIVKIGPTGDLADMQSPQLLISGEIHGDERVVYRLLSAIEFFLLFLFLSTGSFCNAVHSGTLSSQWVMRN